MTHLAANSTMTLCGRIVKRAIEPFGALRYSRADSAVRVSRIECDACRARGFRDADYDAQSVVVRSAEAV